MGPAEVAFGAGPLEDLSHGCSVGYSCVKERFVPAHQIYSRCLPIRYFNAMDTYLVRDDDGSTHALGDHVGSRNSPRKLTPDARFIVGKHGTPLATWHLETALASVRRLAELNITGVLAGPGPGLEKSQQGPDKATARTQKKLRS